MFFGILLQKRKNNLKKNLNYLPAKIKPNHFQEIARVAERLVTTLEKPD